MSGQYKPAFGEGIGGTGGAGSTVVSVGSGAASKDDGLSNLSFIEKHEEFAAQNLVDRQFADLCGKTLRANARFTRYFAVVKIFVRPEELKTITDDNGEKKTIYLPDTVRAEDRFQSCSGLIVALGPECFTNKDGSPRGSRYKIGDFVLFARHDIIRVDFCDVALGVMPDDRIMAVIKDPADWMQGSLVYKV